MGHKKDRSGRKPKRAGRGGNRDPKFTLPLQIKFCERFALGGSVRINAKKVGISSVAVFNHARKNPDFKARFEAARELNTDSLEDQMQDMSTYNVAALFGMLKARRPGTWGNHTKVEGSVSLVASADDLARAQERARVRDVETPAAAEAHH